MGRGSWDEAWTYTNMQLSTWDSQIIKVRTKSVSALSLFLCIQRLCSHSGITISFTRQTNLHNLLTISLRGSARNIPSSPTSDDDYPSSSSHHPVPLLVRCLFEYSSMSCAEHATKVCTLFVCIWPRTACGAAVAAVVGAWKATLKEERPTGGVHFLLLATKALIWKSCLQILQPPSRRPFYSPTKSVRLWVSGVLTHNWARWLMTTPSSCVGVMCIILELKMYSLYEHQFKSPRISD